jgi:hypothetical protein
VTDTLPIAFSSVMIPPLRAGIKTQTRRAITNAPETATSAGTSFSTETGPSHVWTWLSGDPRDADTWEMLGDFKLPYQLGDILWVREEHYKFGHWEPANGLLTKGGKQKWQFVTDTDEVLFTKPDGKIRHFGDPTPGWHKRLARFMFQKDSRQLLEVTEVHVHRLHDISAEDCLAEGVLRIGQRWEVPGLVATPISPQDAYFCLLDHLHGKGFSVKNPWVAAYTFKDITP